MASSVRLLYLITFLAIVNCKPRNTFQNTISQINVDNGGTVKTVSHSQYASYSSYESFGGYRFNNLENTLYMLMANMLRSLKFNLPLPLIQLDPRDFFRRNFNSHPVVTSYGTTNEPTPNLTSTKGTRVITRQPTKPTQPTTTPKLIATTNEDDDDDSTRPIVLLDAKSFENEELTRSRKSPKVQHGSTQAGR